MTWHYATQLFVAAVVALVVVYDVAAAWFGGPDSTVSRVLYVWSLEHPIIPFALGIVIGHILWRN